MCELGFQGTANTDADADVGFSASQACVSQIRWMAVADCCSAIVDFCGTHCASVSFSWLEPAVTARLRLEKRERSRLRRESVSEGITRLHDNANANAGKAAACV
ncbi:hypothetical protein [Dyella sp.]|uniref:hypothetical protein n=1 Tax=Dyella sp. TaxID=1869338 RepID=UPI002D77AA48|nr:hypothetical protein [Dyella sp.]